MKLIPLDLDSIRIGKPLPFSIRTTSGTLLASKGFVFQTRDQVLTMATRGGTLCVDIAESPEQHRAFMGQLDVLVRKEHTIGQIATARIDAGVPTVDPRSRAEETLRSAPPDWHDMRIRATALLRDAKAPDFLTRLGRLHAELDVLSRRMPDATLFALIHFASSELEMYSATHGMLVAVVCIMAARDTLKWDAATVETVGKAALAVVLNRQGSPIGEMVVRDTMQPAYKIADGVTHGEVKVKLQLDRMLGMI